MKVTVGLIPRTGIMGGCPPFDSVGGLAKSPSDLAQLLDILIDDMDLSAPLSGSWSGLRLGFVDPDLWTLKPFVIDPNEDFKRQTYAAMEHAIDKIKATGTIVKQPVPLIPLEEITKDPRGIKQIEDLMS